MTDKEKEFISSLRALMIRYEIKIEKEYDFIGDEDTVAYYFSDGSDIYLSVDKLYISQELEK